MKFLLFGTGEYYSRYKIWFDKKNIAALIDNSKEKQGRYIDDILVIPPEDVFKYEHDAIVILSFYVKSMKSQLMALGVEESKIYHFFDLHELIYHPSIKREVRCYGTEDCYKSGGCYESENCHELKNCYRRKERQGREVGCEKKILLLSQDLTLGGPAIALYHAAQILIKKGYQVVYGSMIDGPLRKVLNMEGIPVIVDENLMIETMKESGWVKGYSFIICNTLNFHVFLSEREQRIPVAWWLHDALFFYDGVRQKVMDRLVADNMKIWSVGPIPARAVRTFRPDLHIENLLYGVADKVNGTNKADEANGVHEANKIGEINKVNRIKEADQGSKEYLKRQAAKMRFTVIGYIEYRKGQDILVEAIKNLKKEFRQEAEFFFVGQNTSLMAEEIIEAARSISEIIVTGPVDRDGIDSMLEQTDILVCPSREDPMPTVAAEAMMHGVPCLISDAAGTAAYIEDGTNGIVFESENAKQLEKILADCITGRFDLEQMGENARRVFEDYFSMEAFEKRFISLMEGVDF